MPVSMINISFHVFGASHGLDASNFWHKYRCFSIRCNYIPNLCRLDMARIGAVIVISGIVLSMAIALYMYTQYQTNFIEANEGEPVDVGPVQYVIAFDGTHMGNEETRPEHTFVKIKIEAENISDEDTRMTGGQFWLVDEKNQNHRAVYGEFSATDLLDDILQPGKPVSWTTQFDVPYDEENQYQVVIRPTKQQTTVDTARICITNC